MTASLSGASADGIAAARRRRIAQRAVLTLSFVILGFGGCLLILAAFLSGFTRPVWIPLAAVASLPTTLLVAGVGTVLTRRMPAGTPDALPSDHFGQLPRTSLAVLSTFPLIAGLVFIAIGIQAAIPAIALGSHPASAIAQRVSEGPQCSRCARPVYVQFQTGRGIEVNASLAGVDGLQSGDGPGLALVYDPSKPSRVMRAADWREGRGSTPVILFGVGVGILVALIGTIVGRVRWRRRAFGQLKPEVPIASVGGKATRGAFAWQVEFADHTSTAYVDGKRIRLALLDRISRDQSVQISDGHRAVLGTGYSRPRGLFGSSSD